MPTRRLQEEQDIDELSILGSQSSNSDESAAFEKALVQHYAAAQEKKRLEKEKKFVEQASVLIQKDLSRPTEALKEFSERMETIYSTFVDEYAATEDKIHRIWSDILAEYHAFETIVRRKYEAGSGLAKDAEKQHLSGLAKIQKACEDCENTIATVVPQLENDLMDED